MQFSSEIHEFSIAKKRRICRPAILILLPFAAVCSAQQSRVGDHEKASVSGIALDSLSKEPLRKVDVVLSRTGREEDSNSYAARTGSDGVFTFTDVEPGAYFLNADKPGYLTGHYGSADGRGEAIELHLSAGQKMDALQLLLSPQAVISGRVLDEDGDPDGRCSVSVISYVWRHSKREPRYSEGSGVDDRGEFRFAGLAPGKYYLSAEPDSFTVASIRSSKPKSSKGRLTTYYPGTLDEEDAAPISVTAGQQVSNLEIKIQRGTAHSVSGKVTGLENVPESTEFHGVRTVSLQRASTAEYSSHWYSGSLEKNGLFRIDGVPPGTYEISVGEPTGWSIHGQTIAISDRNVENLVVPITPPVPLTGKIRLEADEKTPLSDVSIVLKSASGEYEGGYAHVKADGTFHFELVGPGKHRVVVWGKPDSTYVKSIRFGEGESPDGTFDLTSAGSELTIVLARDGAQISGSIKTDSTDPDHAAPPTPKNHTVVLIPDTPDLQRREEYTLKAVFDQYGNFTIEGIAPGEYKLYAWEKIEEDAWENPDLLKQMEPYAVDLTLDANERKQLRVSLMPEQAVSEAMARAGME